MPAWRDYRHAPTAGVRKAPRHEVAGCGAPAVQPVLWGFVRMLDLGNSKSSDFECVHNLGDLARLLQNRGFNVFGPYDFK